jgi:hypothetical protein
MPVSEQRKASMKIYNKNITLENKHQYAMTRIFVRLKSGQQKVIQKNTLTKFPWTETEKEYLKGFIPTQTKKRQRIIEPEPQQEPEPVVEIDYEALLHCDKVKEYLGTRSNYQPKRISGSAIANDTKTMDSSNANTVCRIYKTEDFRTVFNDTPAEFHRKVSEYIIPEGKSKGKTYTASSLNKKIAILFTLLNEYEPAIQYIKNKTTHDFKTYYNELEAYSGRVKQQSQTDTINKAEENKTTQDEIFDTLKQLFQVEAKLKPNSMKSISSNLHYLTMLLYTYGGFNKTIEPQNIAFVPRLDLDKIKIVSNAKQVFRGDGKYYNTATGRMYLNGKDSSKTAYKYNYIVPKYVKDIINASIDKFPREYLLDTYTSATVGRVFKQMLATHTDTRLKTNTDYRHLFETVYAILKVNGNTISNALGHSGLTGKAIYKASVVDEYDDDKRKLIVEFFKTLNK